MPKPTKKPTKETERFEFTEDLLAKYKRPADEPEHYAYDTKLPGLAIRTQFGGNKTYVLRYRVGTKQRKLKLGVVGQALLADVRKEARKAFGQIVNKVDPVSERGRAASAASQTFDTTVAAFLEAKGAEWADSYRWQNNHYLNNGFRKLHSMSLASIDRATVSKQLDAIRERQGPMSMNRAKAAGSSLFNWAFRKGLLGNTYHNPFKGTELAKEVTRERFLKPRELKIIWNGLPDNQFGDIVKLLILTMQRRDEIGGLLTSEFHRDPVCDPLRDEWMLEIKGARYKNGKDNTIPLGKKALELVQKHYDPERKFLFGATGYSGYSGWSKSKLQLDVKLKGINDPWVFHDFRRLGKTVMSEELDVPLEISEAILNHVKKGLEKNYNGAKYIRRKREALDKYNDWVMSVVA